MPGTASKLNFLTSDERLNDGFYRAKEQALFYVHNDNSHKVGPWYEAALPLRQAFCIRDVCHQRIGAYVLGATNCTYNMLKKFAESIDEKRDYCMFWEITRDNIPAAVDYTDDTDFWYNLPANFDMINASLKEYLWTKNDGYINDEAFLKFYKISLNEYITRWDKDADGIPEHYLPYGRRGISSYNEQVFKPFIGGDLLGAMYAAFRAYSKILELKNNLKESKIYAEKAENIKNTYINKWFNKKKHTFFGALRYKDKFYKKYYNEGNFLPVFFGILDNTPYLEKVLKEIAKKGPHCVEAKTYFPQIFYDRGMEDYAYKQLLELCDKKLKRKEYPEVSFTVLGTIVNQYMGITTENMGEVCTLPKLNKQDDYAEITNLSVQEIDLSIKHFGRTKTILENNNGKEFIWKAKFLGEFKEIIIDNVIEKAEIETDAAGRKISYALIHFDKNRKSATAEV